jgi:ribosomal protein L15
MEQNLMPKNAEFYCGYCDFKCFKKSNWNIHINTTKHNYRVNGNNMENAEIDKNAENMCDCGKKYATKSGLWKHKPKCTFKNNMKNTVVKEETNDKDDLILMLIKQNSALIKETSDFKNLMIEQQNMMMKVIENGTHNTTHTNSHNKAFNLNLFLNETCKDAMNINDFVESIKLQVSDLENVGEIGFVEGISNIIVKNLNALDVTKRPIHCTDKKREIIYIKDENTWEKDESQCKMRRMIKKVVSKNQRLIPKFKEQNPEYNKSYSKVSDKYNKLIIESMGGSGDNDLEKENKIIRNIAKNIVVDKSL